jgi:diguanylate cyclase (GGDEF)-like protein
MPSLRLGGPIHRVASLLPRGGTLPEAEWTRRHRMLVAFLWFNAGAIAVYTLVVGHYSPIHVTAHIVGVASFALLAGRPRFSRKLRASFCSIGLLTAAAALVHISGGLVEMHFLFFVFIVALTLYEDWLPFLLAVAYVLVHHGVLGMIDPNSVFDTHSAASAWKWAGIHAAFVSMAGVAGIVAWRLNEDVRAEMREAQDELHEMAVTDVLTGLSNRRRLLDDLNEILEKGETRTLVLFDLNGFKMYNDTFGHVAGDALLVRLGRRLGDASGPTADVYRLGGDEFCMIFTCAEGDAPSLVARGVDALADSGEGFEVTAAHGSAVVPEEATTASDALRLADRRMYAEKAARRGSSTNQTRDVLVSALAARLPDLEIHMDGVAELADEVGRAMGLDGDALNRLGHAARLHDIGKVAIPDAIINKAGPLSDEEWNFMKTHTLIGERILAAAPALAEVVPIVRSSHEWYDGRGYPDGLTGEDIPLESRIILACDSFDAITSDRPYRPRRTEAEAIVELRRCAGKQFDPTVVASFEAALARHKARRADRAMLVSAG